MIRTVEYKECTCDMCGVKENISLEYDRPDGWGWFRVYHKRKMFDYHTCSDCGEKVKSAIESVCGGTRDEQQG